MQPVKPVLPFTLGALLVGPFGVTLAAEAPPATPQQVIAQVRAAQGAIPAGFAPVPAPPVMPAESAKPPVMPAPPPAKPHPYRPTWGDRARLQAELRYVDNVLKVRHVTEANTERASDAIAARGKMLVSSSTGVVSWHVRSRRPRSSSRLSSTSAANTSPRRDWRCSSNSAVRS